MQRQIQSHFNIFLLIDEGIELAPSVYKICPYNMVAINGWDGGEGQIVVY
jgi:hypothetical protein